jgi:predicted regulator of Ras-like GTPase activity (Roadblock/LC7/MglB family)
VPGVGRKTYRALAGIDARSLNKLLGVADDRELSLQEIVKLTSQLKGIDGCMLAMSDGLFLTGQLPNDFDQEAISVFAPQLFKKMGRYVKELRVGQVRRFTLFTDERPISIFRAADVYLIVVHDTRHFSKRLLRQCERISEELARLCRQRTVV